MNKQRPVFIHAQFRTGSTYLWNKFRQNEENWCYYEPFHQDLIKIEKSRPYLWRHDQANTRSIRHPDLSRNYLAEYEQLLRPGQAAVPFFKKSFSFDEFCNNSSNPEQKQYLDFLIAQAGSKRPVFKFTRSSLRVRWFTENYPDAVHIYLVRNPRDQFQSYLLMDQENKAHIFLVMDIIAASVNKQHPPFCYLAAQLPLLEYHADAFDKERAVYSRLLNFYSPEQRFFIFSVIWFQALLENALHAGLIMNINQLQDSAAYRDRVSRRLVELGINAPDFSDCRISTYGQSFPPGIAADSVAARALGMVLRQFAPGERRQWMTVLGEECLAALGLTDISIPDDLYQEGSDTDQGREHPLPSDSLHAFLIDELVRSTLRLQDAQLRLDSLLQSRSYRIGRVLGAPFAALRKVLGRGA
jgi:hypothetical protein